MKKHWMNTDTWKAHDVYNELCDRAAAILDDYDDHPNVVSILGEALQREEQFLEVVNTHHDRITFTIRRRIFLRFYDYIEDELDQLSWSEQ